ncbi:hypothetical protein ACS0TY_021919 [Phlomoides rotata]
MSSRAATSCAPDRRRSSSLPPPLQLAMHLHCTGSAVGSDHSDSDDDWEGVESTDLDEIFSAATTFVAAIAADRAAMKVSNEIQLLLYGLYKIATEGPCSAPQPSAYKMTARAKWKLDGIHAFAREGDEENLLKCIEAGVPLNLKGL